MANMTVFNEEHPKKALDPMEVTEAGIVILVNPDSEKALSPILPSELLLAKVTVFNSAHSLKAF